VREVHKGGVLVFFQSYDKMHKLLKEWDTMNLLNENHLKKKLFFEDADCLKGWHVDDQK
jgi:Rad3-related DNA helicase